MWFLYSLVFRIWTCGTKKLNKLKNIKYLSWNEALHVIFYCWLVAKSNSFVTPWTVAHQALLSVGFPRQEYWSGLPFPPPRDLPYLGIEPISPVSPSLGGSVFTTEPSGKAFSLSGAKFFSALDLSFLISVWLSEMSQVVRPLKNCTVLNLQSFTFHITVRPL